MARVLTASALRMGGMTWSQLPASTSIQHPLAPSTSSIVAPQPGAAGRPQELLDGASCTSPDYPAASCCCFEPGLQPLRLPLASADQVCGFHTMMAPRRGVCVGHWGLFDPARCCVSAVLLPGSAHAGCACFVPLPRPYGHPLSMRGWRHSAPPRTGEPPAPVGAAHRPAPGCAAPLG